MSVWDEPGGLGVAQPTTQQEVETIRSDALRAVEEASDVKSLEAVRVEVLGRKGALTRILRSLGQLSSQERPVVGKRVNAIRDEVEEAIAARRRQLEDQELERRLLQESIDVTLPGRRAAFGSLHPLTHVMREVQEVFVGLGFEVVEGPEIETDYYNFEALNIPPHHPARDMQDTFYITEDILLRTQTSPVQIRTMESRQPPVRVIAPGKVYRSDAPDVSHSPMFHQIEGLLIDKGITFGDLKGTLTLAARHLFGHDRGVRFRPSYFPFTEPSAELDIQCILCDGEGCRLCSGEGWIEVLGAGMVHPNVLRMVDYDPAEVGGFAFGMGVERVALLKYGIEDIRLLFESDVRFLRQF